MSGKKSQVIGEATKPRTTRASFTVLQDSDAEFPALLPGLSLKKTKKANADGKNVAAIELPPPGKVIQSGQRAMTMVLDPNADAAQSGVVTNAEIRHEGITAGAVKTGAVVVAPAAKDTAAAVNVGAKTTNPEPWSALFKDNRDPSHGIKLRYVPPKGATLDFGDRILPSMVEMWGFCLVGHFTGKFPGLKAVHDLRAKWGVKCFVKSHNKGWVIFKFTNEEDRMKVLHDGPYMVFGKLLMLKELSEDFSFEDEEFLKVPIWVKFPKLPMKLWNDEAMSEVASMVGVPITTDKITKERMNNEYARVLIEVDVSKPPPLSFPIRLPSKKVFNQSVLYETFPNYCFHCKEFGHHPFICNKLSNCGEGGSRGKDKQVVAVEEIDEVGLTSIRAESSLPASEATAMPALELAATPKFDAISEIQGPTVDVVTLDEPALTQAAAPANNDAATAITNGVE
ncbi:unnamed protein product, partial [Cuscuta europaea]